MSSLSIFRFENQEVRFVGTADDPWWVATDICAVLEIKNTSQAIDRLDEDQKGICSTYTPGGKQEMLCVNEPGFYELVIRSDKPQAKRFRKWVTSVVLPEIRRTGSYSLRKLPEPKLEEINLIFAELAEIGIKLELVKAAKLELIAKTYPHLKDVTDSAKALLAANSTIEEMPMSPTELGKAIATKLNLPKPISAIKINKALVDAGLQVVVYRKNSKGKQEAQYRITESGKKHGQMQQTTARNSDGVVFQVRWFSSAISAIAFLF